MFPSNGFEPRFDRPFLRIETRFSIPARAPGGLN
jgi:hypothetical protein